MVSKAPVTARVSGAGPDTGRTAPGLRSRCGLPPEEHPPTATASASAAASTATLIRLHARGDLAVAQERLDEVVVAVDQAGVEVAYRPIAGSVEEDRAARRPGGEIARRRERAEDLPRGGQVPLRTVGIVLQLGQLQQARRRDRGRRAVARLVRDAGRVEVPVRDPVGRKMGDEVVR